MIRSLAIASLLVATACTSVPRTPEAPAVSAALRNEFAPSGVLVVGVNYGNPVIVQKDPAGGEPRGVGAELARELARRLGVPVRYVTFDTAAKAADALKQRAIDIGFLAVDPARATDIDFSAPYVDIEGTYLVRRDSPLRSIADVDREGIRVAVGDKTAYDLYLTRALKNAKLVKAPTSIAAVEYFMAQKLDAAAGVKNPLAEIAAKDPALRVIEGSFMVIGQAAGVPRGRPAAARYLHDFVEEAKASGFVARALAASGITDATVSRPAGSRR